MTDPTFETREALEERAAIVAWLRNLHWTHNCHREAQFFAAAIESGVHLLKGQDDG